MIGLGNSSLRRSVPVDGPTSTFAGALDAPLPETTALLADGYRDVALARESMWDAVQALEGVREMLEVGEDGWAVLCGLDDQIGLCTQKSLRHSLAHLRNEVERLLARRACARLARDWQMDEAHAFDDWLLCFAEGVAEWRPQVLLSLADFLAR